MSSKKVRSLSDEAGNTYKAGPWFVRVNRHTRRAEVTSGDVWFAVSRDEAALVLRRKLG